MNKNIDQFCRKSRSRSISPSISFDNKRLTEQELQEAKIYSAPVNEMVKELYTSFDDLIKFINHSLLNKIKDSFKQETNEEELNDIESVYI